MATHRSLDGGNDPHASRKVSGVTVIVGGAVLNEEYAEMIHADKYCEDAMDTVRFAQSFYSDNVSGGGGRDFEVT